MDVVSAAHVFGSRRSRSQYLCVLSAPTLSVRVQISPSGFHLQRYVSDSRWFVKGRPFVAVLLTRCSWFFAGAYFHPCFARENRALCRQIVRPKSVSSNSSRTTSRSRSKKASQSEASRCSDADTVESSSTVELKQTLLGGTFEPLSCNRGMPALIGYSGSEKQSKDTSRTQTVVPRYTGVVSPPLTDLGQDEGSPSDSQQMATESLLKNLQLAMAGRGFPMPAGSELPDFLQGGVTVSNASSFEGRERLEIHEPHIPAGPILSMSTGNWNWMNVETHASEGPGVSLLSSGRYGTASIQELEPYSDSIITLFGSCSDFLD